MNKLKVLQIIPSFGVGGAEKLVLDYLTYFDKDTVDIRAISMYSNKNTHYDKSIKDNGLHVYYLDKKPGLDLSMIRKIKRIILDFQPDVIHSHLYCMKYLLFSTWNKSITQYHTIHNEPQKDATGIDKLFNKIAFTWFGVTPIGLSDELSKKINQYYNITTTIPLNNGVYLSKYKNVRITKEDAKVRLGLHPESFVVGHVGRFFQQKNHTFIIDIFSELHKKDKNAFLLLVGEGELRNEVEEKVKKKGLKSNVVFLGIRSDIPQVIKAMDVFLFPSLHEGFPITLIEAQTTDVRCVISDKIDPKSILSENTVSVSLDAPFNDWVSAIKDPTIRTQPLGKIDDYDICKIVTQLERIYRNSI